ncbi:aminopeptidase N [Propionibacterium freudenreichii]|uniref:aminopeptidase N n=1 Tax=Propionibacterium freudenreichii TaxID=1744 RepID=UPI00254B85FC|nr:aminopeptidase N [Propionibacterium freudenreichii]MDK9352699.1 aminopeptidase N [Propionibacterium freudenreichii]
MNPANLTRDETHARSAMLSVTSYRVSVDLTGGDGFGRALAEPDETFVSTSIVNFSTSGGDTWIDLIADSVVSAELDGTRLDASTFTGVRLPFSAEAGEHELRINALCRYSHTGEGLHRFVDPADQRVYLYTQFETADARRMYACFEQPDLKASFQLSVIAPSAWTVVSNSPTPPATATDAPAFQRWDFEATAPISTYITALIAGEYFVNQGTITSTKGELGANIVCRQSVAQYLDADRIRTTTQRGFEVYEEAFGRPYPFAKYDQLFVPEYNAGAMENAGAVTIRDEYLYRSKVTSADYEQRDNTILHELAHMWFGDLVTMRWWDDLWLNESFAEWCSHFAQKRIVDRFGGIDPWVSFANAREGWAYVQDQMPTTHPIAADMVDLETVDQSFDGITYAKGASVLKQLVAYVGEQNFLAGVREYLTEHAYANAEFSDLLGALQKASGKDLDGFAEQWLKTSGVNTLRAQVEVDDSGAFTRFDIIQTAPVEHPTLRTHHIGVGCYELRDGQLVRTTSLELDVSGERTSVDALVGQPRPALVLLNDQDLSYAKVRLDKQSLDAAIEHITELADPLARAVVWTCVWDMNRDAELTTDEYISTVTRGIGSETDMTAVRTQLRNALGASKAYTPPAHREEANRALVAGIAAELEKAEPGSQHQLAFTDALIESVDSPEGITLIRGWLSNEEVPVGLEIDQDRRWAILSSLARMGAVDDDAIAAEEQLDKTISGSERAAGARAALNNAEEKARAWALATEDPKVPNATHLRICAAFVQYGQEELLAPYVDRYLQVCELISAQQGIWATRGHAASQAVLTYLWPSPLADRAFIERVDKWVESSELSESVRHVITERRDASLRAIAAQEFAASQLG